MGRKRAQDLWPVSQALSQSRGKPVSLHSTMASVQLLSAPDGTLRPDPVCVASVQSATLPAGRRNVCAPRFAACGIFINVT